MATAPTTHGQGEVKHPETDKRLKENRDDSSTTKHASAETKSGEHDRRHDNTGQGHVTDPAHDGRLKENRDHGVSMHTTEGKEDVEQGGQGRVKDPEHDQRLKDNRGN